MEIIFSPFDSCIRQLDTYAGFFLLSIFSLQISTLILNFDSIFHVNNQRLQRTVKIFISTTAYRNWTETDNRKALKEKKNITMKEIVSFGQISLKCCLVLYLQSQEKNLCCCCCFCTTYTNANSHTHVRKCSVERVS